MFSTCIFGTFSKWNLWNIRFESLQKHLFHPFSSCFLISWKSVTVCCCSKHKPFFPQNMTLQDRDFWREFSTDSRKRHTNVFCTTWATIPRVFSNSWLRPRCSRALWTWRNSDKFAIFQVFYLYFRYIFQVKPMKNAFPIASETHVLSISVVFCNNFIAFHTLLMQ